MSKCHICGAEVKGESDNHMAWVSFNCACGHSWSEARLENVDKQRELYLEAIHDKADGFFEEFADRKGLQ